LEASQRKAGYLPQDGQAYFAISIDVWVESGPSIICGNALHEWRFGGVFFGNANGKLKEPKLIRSLVRPYDECLEATNIDISAGYRDGKIRIFLKITYLLRDADDGLVHVDRDEGDLFSRLRQEEWGCRMGDARRRKSRG
jgi:hypothetical protein